ncbi:MAG: hypothetical protein BWY66_02916 [bacterium ADurb.Bin374]|nr:MAG: hypothetical protein BWY66_02916 [bacterium ADurb.Bin374]
MGEATRSENAGEGAPTSAVAFLIPTYKTPRLTADLLSAALACGKYDGCVFVLLLSLDDPNLLSYKTLVDNVREKGLSAGYFIFDGTPYCGMINRVAPIVPADCLCVLDSTHLPFVDGDESFAENVRKWLASSPEPMRVGAFTAEGFYPLVTRKLADRLGYLFHPLCYGRIEAENWLLSVAGDLGLLSTIPGGGIIESSADGVEIIGTSVETDSRWVDDTLAQTLDDETERLAAYLVR